MSQENVEIVRRLTEAFNLGDAKAAFELLDDAFEWWDREDDLFASVHRGREECAKHPTDIYDQVDYMQMEVKELIDAGDYVVAGVRVHGRGRASGAPVEMHEFHVLELRDGKATQLREFRTKAEALEAVGLSE